MNKVISPILIFSTRKLVPIFFLLSALVSSCSIATPATPAVDMLAPTQTAVTDVFPPTPPVLESTPAPTSGNEAVQLSASDSDRLGLCFSYPQGYTQLPTHDVVEIAALDLPGSDVKALFWLEISEAYGRSAETIADQDLTFAAGVDVGRWTLTLAGEPAVVLDGMPGQDLQRRMYVVHGQTLYVLAFMPTRSGNQAANDQMEALFTAVTNSWAWSPCSGGE